MREGPFYALTFVIAAATAGFLVVAVGLNLPIAPPSVLVAEAPGGRERIDAAAREAGASGAPSQPTPLQSTSIQSAPGQPVANDADSVPIQPRTIIAHATSRSPTEPAPESMRAEVQEPAAEPEPKLPTTAPAIGGPFVGQMSASTEPAAGFDVARAAPDNPPDLSFEREVASIPAAPFAPPMVLSEPMPTVSPEPMPAASAPVQSKAARHPPVQRHQRVTPGPAHSAAHAVRRLRCATSKESKARTKRSRQASIARGHKSSIARGHKLLPKRRYDAGPPHRSDRHARRWRRESIVVWRGSPPIFVHPGRQPGAMIILIDQPRR